MKMTIWQNLLKMFKNIKENKMNKKIKNNPTVPFIGKIFPVFYTQDVVISIVCGVVGCGKGIVYLTSLGRPTDTGLQLGKACYPCTR